eukprot:SAG11_NODE_2583_length_3195_cov_188.324935_4_plen_58_part_00
MRGCGESKINLKNKIKTHGNARIEVDLRGSGAATKNYKNYPTNHVKKIYLYTAVLKI